MSLGKAIRHRRVELGLTQDQVAAKAEISKPYLSNIETARAKNPPTDHVLERLEQALDLEPMQLRRQADLERTPREIRREHESLKTQVEKLRRIVGDLRAGRKVESSPLSADDYRAGGLLVPVINHVRGGYPQSFTDLDYPPGVADEYVRCPDVRDAQAFAARVCGDSMGPRYNEGDIVVFSPNTPPRSGDDCFVRFGAGEGTTFKRFYQDEAGAVRLQPLNNAYPARVYRPDDITGLWPAVLRIEKLR